MPIISPRIKAAIKYLKRADSFYKWRLSHAPCPNCEGRLFLSLSNDPFMTRCLKCAANVTNLAIISAIRSLPRAERIRRVWEMSTYGATLNYLKKHHSNVVTSEYFPQVASGTTVNGILSQDVQKLSFDSAGFDLITSNQVFEHVPDDISGYRECHRVLRPGGALIFTVPLYDTPQTIRTAEICAGKIVLHDTAEYHDSRAGGPNTALVFWRHSQFDICERVASAGFNAELIDIVVSPSQGVPAQVIRAVKD